MYIQHDWKICSKRKGIEKRVKINKERVRRNETGFKESSKTKGVNKKKKGKLMQNCQINKYIYIHKKEIQK